MPCTHRALEQSRWDSLVLWVSRHPSEALTPSLSSVRITFKVPPPPLQTKLHHLMPAFKRRGASEQDLPLVRFAPCFKIYLCGVSHHDKASDHAAGKGKIVMRYPPWCQITYLRRLDRGVIINLAGGSPTGSCIVIRKKSRCCEKKKEKASLIVTLHGQPHLRVFGAFPSPPRAGRCRQGRWGNNA